MAFTNSINATTPGIVGLSSAGVWTGTSVSQYNLLVGGATNQVLVNIAPSATSGVPLISQGSAANPAFGTVVVAGGGTGLASLTAYGLLAGGTTSTGNLQQVGVGSAGQVLTSNGAGNLPSFQAPAGGFTWSSVTSGTQTIAVANGYITNNATTVTYTLPATAAQGTIFEISSGASAASTVPWTIAQGAGQSIAFGNATTTVGAGGSLSATLKYDSLRALCVVADTQWVILSSMGNITVV